MIRLRHATPREWTAVVRANLDSFLKDHAANERKVSGSALTLAVQHPERASLVDAMIRLAREELEHFQQVYELLVARGQTLGQDMPDPYMGALRKVIRKRVVSEYLLDRLLVFAVVEARGCERFALLARNLEPGDLRDFYRRLARDEARHRGIFVRLARGCAPAGAAAARLEEILDHEAQISRRLPLRPALH